MHSALLLTTIIPIALGAAVDTRAVCKTFNDNYDNIPAQTAAVPISNYNGLVYQGWEVINHNSTTTPVAAHTEPNVIFADAVTDLETIGAVTLVPFGNLRRGTGTKAFNLYSFYFGCSQNDADTEGAADIAVPCTVAVTGYDVYNRQIPVATFSFAPTVTINAKPNFATLPFDFYNLQNVTFGLSSGGGVGGTAGTVLVVDDIVHCNYS